MRTVRTEVRGHQVVIERPDPLVLWLDTLVYVNIANRDEGGDERVARMFDVLGEAVARDRVVVVAGAERDEVFARWREFQRAQLGITQERRFQDWIAVQNAEFSSAMAAWAGGRQEFSVSAVDVYEAATFRTASEQPDFTMSASLGTEEASRRAWFESAARTAASIESVRSNNVAAGRTFAKALAGELDGSLYWPMRVVDRHLRGEHQSAEHLANAQATLRDYLSCAESAGKPGNESVAAFLDSEAARALPSLWVYSVLWTDMVTGTEGVKGGDSFDTQHLRLAVPYADIVVTDKRMANRIRTRKLDDQFSSKVYSMKQLDDLTAYLAAVTRST